MKWDNVQLSLSTGNPGEGMQSPELLPWYLSIYVPQVIQQNLQYKPSATPGVYQNKRKSASLAMAGGRAAGVYIIDGVQTAQNESSINDYVSVDNSGVNASFDIDLPYTIPSDGQQHLVAVKQYESPATYQYFAVPKSDKDAFLEARLTKWEDLNLLPGKTNIFYEGTYMGQGMIDPANVKDTMNISLGRDKKIVVKRERDRLQRSVKTIGTNVRETFAYNITVRNTRKEPITLLLQDQMPVSNDKDILIEDRENGGSDFDETTGALKWTLSLAPNETKKVSFGYTVKYPKGKTLANAQ